jgi:hypothetical protein
MNNKSTEGGVTMSTLSLISGQKPKLLKAKGKCKCRGGKHHIKANDGYFAIPDRLVKGHYTPTPKRYCAACFNKIMTKTENDLEAFRKVLAKYIGT